MVRVLDQLGPRYGPHSDVAPAVVEARGPSVLAGLLNGVGVELVRHHPEVPVDVLDVEPRVATDGRCVLRYLSERVGADLDFRPL